MELLGAGSLAHEVAAAVANIAASAKHDFEVRGTRIWCLPVSEKA
jgi:hypothetical protein